MNDGVSQSSVEARVELAPGQACTPIRVIARVMRCMPRVTVYFRADFCLSLSRFLKIIRTTTSSGTSTRSWRNASLRP